MNSGKFMNVYLIFKNSNLLPKILFFHMICAIYDTIYNFPLTPVEFKSVVIVALNSTLFSDLACCLGNHILQGQSYFYLFRYDTNILFIREYFI